MTVGDVAVAPVASVTLTARVWLPLRRFLVFQPNDAVVVATVWVFTTAPSTRNLKVLDVPEAPVTLALTVTVALTTALLAGLVIDADMVDVALSAKAPRPWVKATSRFVVLLIRKSNTATFGMPVVGSKCVQLAPESSLRQTPRSVPT